MNSIFFLNFTILNLRKISPAILTLLIFLLAQGLGTVLVFGIGMLVSPDFNIALQAYLSGEAQGLPLFELLPISLFSLILMGVNILAVLCCYFLIHNIHFATACDFSTIRWCPGMLAIVGGFLGALSISILTESIELPDAMLQLSLAMSNNLWGLIALVIVGPITEELLFREAIEGEMLRREANPWMAILVSAIAFSIVHLNLAQGLYAFPLAVIFGIIYYKTGNIILTSVLHILNNGLAALQLYTLGEDIENISYAEWFGGQTNAYLIAALCGALCLILTAFFWRYHPSDGKQ